MPRTLSVKDDTHPYARMSYNSYFLRRLNFRSRYVSLLSRCDGEVLGLVAAQLVGFVQGFWLRKGLPQGA